MLLGKLCLLFALVGFSISVAALTDVTEQDFEEYLLKFGKSYTSFEEKQERFKLFKGLGFFFSFFIHF